MKAGDFTANRFDTDKPKQSVSPVGTARVHGGGSIISSRRERGVATLAISVILLLSLTVMALTMTQSGVIQQKISGNDYRAKEAHNAAEAGMQYLIGWLSAHQSSLVTTGTHCVTPPTAGLASGTDTYTLNDASGNSKLCYTVAMLNSSGAAQVIKLTSTARASNDPSNSISATVTQIVSNTPGINSKITITAPPLVITGCTDSIEGNPVINTSNIAIMTMQASGKMYNNHACIQLGHLNENCQPNAQTPSSGCNLNYYRATPGETVWHYYFGNITQSLMQSLADAQATLPATQRTIYYITDSSPWHQSLGSADNPVIMIFSAAAGCPKINGNPTIYGVIYYASNSCDTNGWGGATVYGSVGIEGNLNKLNANTNLNLVSPSSTTSIHTGLPGVYAPLPGTWKDW